MYVTYLVLGHYALPPEFAVSVPMGDGSFQQIETTRRAWTDVVMDLDRRSFLQRMGLGTAGWAVMPTVSGR